jgi:hypothetical protein
MNGGDIIIKGGSVDLIFDDYIYPKRPADPHSHASPTKKMTRIVIVGEEGAMDFDSGDHPQGLQCSVTIFTR